MKLKKGFVLHQVGEEYMAVATGEAGQTFHGLIRNNETADFIYRMLQSDIKEEALADALYERYDCPKEQIMEDLKPFLQQLRGAGFLDE